MNRHSQTIAIAGLVLAVIAHLTYLLMVSGKVDSDWQIVPFVGVFLAGFLGILTLGEDASREAKRPGELALAIATTTVLVILVVGFDPGSNDDTPPPSDPPPPTTTGP